MEEKYIKLRLELLNKFIEHLNLILKKQESSEESEIFINKNLKIVKKFAHDVGIYPTGTHSTFNAIYSNIDIFENVFLWDGYKYSLLPAVVQHVQQAMGIYEYMLTEDQQFFRKSENVDIEPAIKRSLRPSFKNKTPENEREIQDAIEIILRSIGIDFTREKESISVGGKSVIPDFIVKDDFVIEVKYTRNNTKLSQIQEQMNADIAAYLTKWKRILFVIYDDRIINDPEKFTSDNMRLFGVNVLIIKH